MYVYEEHSQLRLTDILEQSNNASVNKKFLSIFNEPYQQIIWSEALTLCRYTPRVKRWSKYLLDKFENAFEM